MTAYGIQQEFFDFYQKEFSWKSLIDPRWFFNLEILRSKLLIYLLVHIFKKDMVQYLSYIEENSAITIHPDESAANFMIRREGSSKIDDAPPKAVA